MSKVRTYVMPGSADEKRALVEELCRHYAAFFGVPTRQALVAQWWESSVQELRFMAGNWRGLLRRRAESGRAAAEPSPAIEIESRASLDARWRKLFPASG